jgi:hypothetical protein
MWRNPSIIFKIVKILINITEKFPVIGSILFLIPCFLLLLTGLSIVLSTNYLETSSPIWFNFLTLNQGIDVVSWVDKIKINTKNYNYTGAHEIFAYLSGFTGIEIDSTIFGGLLLGYANKVRGSVYYLVPEIALISDDNSNTLTVTKVGEPNINWGIDGVSLVAGPDGDWDENDLTGTVEAGDVISDCFGNITAVYKGTIILGTWTFSVP